jgi:hypothetical protein
VSLSFFLILYLPYSFTSVDCIFSRPINNYLERNMRTSTLHHVCPSVSLQFTTRTPLNGFALRIFNDSSFGINRAAMSDIYMNTCICISEHLERISCIIRQVIFPSCRQELNTFYMQYTFPCVVLFS